MDHEEAFEEMWGQSADPVLFDDTDDETVVSGNSTDPLDSIKSVCLTCCGTNGQHSLSCTEDFE